MSGIIVEDLLSLRQSGSYSVYVYIQVRYCGGSTYVIDKYLSHRENTQRKSKESKKSGFDLISNNEELLNLSRTKIRTTIMIIISVMICEVPFG